MSNEATVQCSLQISQGYKTYRSQPTSFLADVAGTRGPAPGAFSASTSGTDIDFSQLTSPGLCRIQNLDTANNVEVGLFDSVTNRFFPLMLLKPGESYVIRLSPNIELSYSGVGTGITGTGSLMAKATNQACMVLVEAFDS